jgi:bifunctional DNase/RNase
MRIRQPGILAGLMMIGLVTIAAKGTGTSEKAAPGAGGPQEAEVSGVVLDPQSRQPLLVLQGKRDKRNLVLAIGHFEAERIAIPLQGVTPPRPLTHDLIVNLLADLKTPLRRVVITDLKDDVYYAVLYIDSGSTVLKLDSRPSDAIALALRAKVPILIEELVFDKAERVMPKIGPSPHF